MSKVKVGILGATGTVGQRFITLLEDHPFFDVVVLAASSNSSGKTYEKAGVSKWKLAQMMPEYVKEMIVKDVMDVDSIAKEVDMVFCALDMDKEPLLALEDAYAKAEIVVVSNNSANRWTQDIPMIIPEVNPEHLSVIEFQKKRLGTKRGFIVVKSNCSIQSYVPALHALKDFGIEQVMVSTYQAISGSGKNFEQWPEMIENLIPYIGGEEEKSEKEPLKIWGNIEDGKILNANSPVISAQCLRVSVLDGHTASCSVKFKNKPTKEEILTAWKNMEGEPQKLSLPLAPKQFITYFEEDNRPQPKLDVMIEKGMGISVGRLREDNIFDYKFVCLSHNTVRGAAGGAVLLAELLYKKGYMEV